MDKENTPEADAKSSVQGRPSNPQRMSGHSRTPSGHDAMTRDMGNLQLNLANRHDQPVFAVHDDCALVYSPHRFLSARAQQVLAA